MANLLATKPLSVLMNEAQETGEHSLKRALGPVNLVTLGIGAIIGAGIFVLTGNAAAQYAGPAITLSYVLAGLGCVFAGLCYAEFASLIPIAGSAYTYGYATLGEFFAWIIGWDLILEYAFGAATVASGWAGTIIFFLQSFGINLPPRLTATPGTDLYFVNNAWQAAGAPSLVGLSPSQLAALPHEVGIFNLIAFLGIMMITVILVVGIKESANFNTTIVFIKLVAVVIFIAVAASWVIAHPAQARANWTPFIPLNTGSFGSHGWSGIARGASVVFFAYIGFDAVSTAAQEARNPQRDMPIGIMGSLLICTFLYIVVAGLLTGVVHYPSLNVAAPVSLAMQQIGLRWGSILVNAGAIAGLSTVMLVMMLGQTRVFYSMSRDGLLWKWAGEIHPRFRTPWKSTIIMGLFVGVFTSVVPIGILGQLVSIGTLLAFVIVSVGVMILRKRRPDLHRPFRTPWVPFVPIMAIVLALGLMLALPHDTWIRLVVWLAIGMVIYFTYGRHHSKVQQGHPEAVLEPTR
ncbi:MAG TPA: amino acid permease [Terriglobales bacterium]|jgi:APA family basic amino acid/polyamine antiporter|nr:amino acid permease [Terriglobales bacterium]